MAVDSIPAGYHTVTPYIVVEGADRLIAFLRQTFDADTTMRMDGPEGSVGHAEVKIGDSKIMLADANEQASAVTGMLHVYVDDCDDVYARALEAGATSLQEPENQFYGDRMAGVRDAFGYQWWIATHVEDVPEDELTRRAQERATS